MNIWERIWQSLNNVWSTKPDTESPDDNDDSVSTTQRPMPIHPKICTIIFDPIIKNNNTLSRIMGWNNTDDLIQQYITDIRDCSSRYVNYEVVETHVINDALPQKEDGFSYDPAAFLDYLRAGEGFHKPDTTDYHLIIKEYNILQKIANHEIDELWLFGPPYSGFYESRMAGPGAFTCNSPPLANSDAAERRFIIMGFNYERGVGEMLENMGHRAEAIIRRVFRNTHGIDNHWERFTRIEKTHPDMSEVGTVHFAPNSQHDYDWNNTNKVLSYCDSWYRFPQLDNDPREVNCSEWGNGNMRLHHLWWLRHFPHFTGSTNNISHNWWEYIINPQKVI